MITLSMRVLLLSNSASQVPHSKRGMQHLTHWLQPHFYILPHFYLHQQSCVYLQNGAIWSTHETHCWVSPWMLPCLWNASIPTSLSSLPWLLGQTEPLPAPKLDLVCLLKAWALEHPFALMIDWEVGVSWGRMQGWFVYVLLDRILRNEWISRWRS